MNQRYNKIQKMMVVSLVGRPNVGKSSLFNRLMKKQHKAITFDVPGVTRDRHYGVAKLHDPLNTTSVEYILVDTGGFFPEKVQITNPNKEEAFFNIMADQARTAVKESDLVLLVVDVREGPSPFDEMIVRFLRAQGKKFFVLTNKWDSEAQSGLEHEFFRFGIAQDQLFNVSAAHGTGIENLMDSLWAEQEKFEGGPEHERTQHLGPGLGVVPREEVIARLALIGAPNAGKSTLLNFLVGAQRSLVSDIPGTTVDPIEGHFDLYFGVEAEKLDQYKQWHKNNDQVYSEFENVALDDSNEEPLEEEIFSEGELPQEESMEGDFIQEIEDTLGEAQNTLTEEYSETETVEVASEEVQKSQGSFWRSLAIVDTAGIRRQKSIEGQIETMAVYQSLRAISESDVVILVVDATKGITHQDRRLADLALEKGKSLIVALNKVDLLRAQLKGPKEERLWIEDIRRNIPWLDFVQMIPLSAQTGVRVKALKEAIKKTVLVRLGAVSTGKLNQLVGRLVSAHSVVLKNSRGAPMKVRYASQVKSSPPTFVLFCNKAQGVPDHYRRYLANAIRREFQLVNTPVHLVFRTGKENSNLSKD